MLLDVLVAILIAPILVSLGYSFVWPRPRRRRVVLSVIGSVVGAGLSCIAIYFLTQPIIAIGVGRERLANPAFDDTMSGPAAVALFSVVAATVVLLVVIARRLCRAAQPL